MPGRRDRYRGQLKFAAVYELRFDVYGRQVAAVRESSGWVLYDVGEGKRRVAHDLKVPPEIEERDLRGYLADLCHERATRVHPDVHLLP